MARVRAAEQQEECKSFSIVALICFKSRNPGFPKQIVPYLTTLRQPSHCGYRKHTVVRKSGGRNILVLLNYIIRNDYQMVCLVKGLI
jgi:hypothetical protein